jgi:DNA polymerase-3 subunit alpha
VLPPDVNASQLDFAAEDRPGRGPAIRFGLAAVKNVGVGAVEAILRARHEGGPFRSLEDFARRVDLRQLGKRALECLVRVGALDAFGRRASLLESVDRLLSFSASHFRAAEVGQLSLFGASTGVAEKLELPTNGTPVSKRQQLQWERELLGVYASDHPLSPYWNQLASIVTHFSAELREAEHGQSLAIAGEVAHVRAFQTRSGKEMAFLTLEDLQGAIELVVFQRRWREVSRWLEPGMIVFVRGRLDAERGDPKVLVDEITRELPSASPTEADREQSGPAGAGAGAARRPPDHDPHDDRSAPRPMEDSPAVELPAEAQFEPPLPEGGACAPSLAPSPRPSEDVLAPGAAAGAPTPAAPTAERRVVTVRLRSTGDRERDTRRMRRVHGLLTSYPGKDRFVFLVFEGSKHFHLEFPNSSTGFCRELHVQLCELLGDEAVQIEALRIQ